MKKKLTLTVTALVLVMTVAIGGTLAYFTDTDKAVNTFTTGGLNITLDEPDWVEANGMNVVPGREIPKNPGITVEAGSVESYVRAVVKMPKVVYENSNFYHTPSAEPAILFENQNGAFQNVKVVDVDAKTVEVYLDFDSAVSATTDGKADLGDLFTSMKFSGEIENSADDPVYSALADGGQWSVDVTAYAAQAEGFATADAAMKAAFPEKFGN